MLINWNDGTTTTKNNKGKIITYKNKDTMQIYKFVYTYKDGKTLTYFREYKHPKKSNIYKKAIMLLNKDIIDSFTYSIFL